MEKTNKQGPYDQKLCNFTPYLTAEITVDDGACETKRLRIGGEHENGRTLKEIEIAGSELASFNWLLEHWGIDCNLEIGCSIKDSIRYAIQSTAPKALRETIYTVTGWKKINGEWKYLLPGDDALTVELTGKLKRYEMAKDYSIEDIAIASAMLEVGIAPKEIIYPLIAFTFLSPLNEFLHRANCEPKFVMLLLGKTGTRKSTLAALFFPSLVGSLHRTCLFPSEILQIECEFTPENTTDKTVAWASSDETIISVSSDGEITANKLGTATITATHKEFTDSIDIEVKPIDAKSIEIVLPDDVETNDTGEPKLKKGSQMQLKTKIEPENTTYKGIEWSVSEEGIASIDENGVLTANATGIVIVTAEAKSGVTETIEIEVYSNAGDTAAGIIGLAAIGGGGAAWYYRRKKKKEAETE